MRIFTPAVLIALSTLLAPSMARSQVKQNWQQTFATPAAYHLDISSLTATDASGNVIVGAVFYPNNFNQYSGLGVYKYTASGTLAWSHVFQSDAVASYAVGVATDAAGNSYLLFRNTIGDSTNPHGAQLMKYTPDGGLAWSIPLPNNETMTARAMTVDAAGNVYVTGSNNNDYATIKFNTNGVVQWTGTYNGTASGYDEAQAVAADASGNVYVTGYSPGQETIRLIGPGGRGGGTYTLSTGQDIATVKYDSSGNTLWTVRYSGSLNDDEPSSIALDPVSGNVYVGGQTWTTEYYVAVGDVLAYSSSGTQLWAYRDTMATNTVGVAVDPSGNVITNENSSGSQPFLVRKFSPSGSIAWTFPTAPNSYYSSDTHFVALDKLGNVYVSSYWPTGPHSYSFAATQLSSDGLQEWQVINTTPVYWLTAMAVFTPVSRLGQVVYPQVDVTYVEWDNLGINTVQYQQVPQLKLLSTADSLTGDAATLETPTAARLANYPNPFHGTTTITYTLSQNSHVTLQVYDGTGRPVATLVNQDQTAGTYTLPFGTAGRLAAGIYEYRIIAQSPQGSFTQTKQMIVE